MNFEMVDQREQHVKTYVNSCEKHAIESVATELGVSSSKLLLMLFRKYLRERQDAERIRNSGLTPRPDLGLE